MKVITVTMRNGANHSYNDKDYPGLKSYTLESTFKITYNYMDCGQRTLLIVPIDNIKYVKYKYTEK